MSNPDISCSHGVLSPGNSEPDVLSKSIMNGNKKDAIFRAVNMNSDMHAFKVVTSEKRSGCRKGKVAKKKLPETV